MAAAERAALSAAQVLALSEAGVLPRSILLPFHEVRELSWDEASGTGRIEAVRRNRFDDWFYACHFLGDPVMPGCWGLDAVWQALKVFAHWRGLPGAFKPLGMEGVSFFGQIRPYDREIVYAVEVTSLERDGGDSLLTAKATVSVDATPVYTIDSAQVGTCFWDGDGAAAPELPPAPARDLRARLNWSEFSGRADFTAPEIVALARGALVQDPPHELPLLPDSLMLEVTDVRRLRVDADGGEGEVLATRRNGRDEWFYPMNAGVKPAALLVDGVWQLMGVYHARLGSAGMGRALGFERVEFFGEASPGDGEIVYRLRVLKTVRALGGDVFVRADAEVFAGGRKLLACANANVGCHRGIRYEDYPLASEMGRGGKLKVKG